MGIIYIRVVRFHEFDFERLQNLVQSSPKSYKRSPAGFVARKDDDFEKFDNSSIDDDASEPETLRKDADFERLENSLDVSSNSANHTEPAFCRKFEHAYVRKPGCRPRGVQPSRGFLITGTGRSGTTFVVEALRRLGLNISHDDDTERGEDGACSWPHAVRWQTFPGLQESFWWAFTVRRQFTLAFLIVREPLKQISSRSGNGFHTLIHMAPTALFSDTDVDEPVPFLNKSIRWALRHWVLQNTFVETYADGVIRIEDFTQNLSWIERLCKLAFTKVPSCHRDVLWNALQGVSNTTNTEHTKSTSGVSWKLLADLDRPYTAIAQQLALNYSYSVEESDRLPEIRAERRCRWYRSRWSCSLKTPSLQKKRPKKAQYRICMTTVIALDFEVGRILDWIAYHNLLGVERFILALHTPLSNVKKGKTRRVYRLLRSSNLVVLRNVTKLDMRIGGQFGPSDESTLRIMSTHHCKYLAIVDADELIQYNPAGKTNDAFKPPGKFRKFLDNHFTSPAIVAMYMWRFDFGTSGYADFPNHSLPEYSYFTQRLGDPKRNGGCAMHGKLLLNIHSGVTPLHGILHATQHSWCHPDGKNKVILSNGDVLEHERLDVVLDRRGLHQFNRKKAMRCYHPKYNCQGWYNPVSINHYITGTYKQCTTKALIGMHHRNRTIGECENYHSGHVGQWVTDETLKDLGHQIRKHRNEIFHMASD